MIRGASSRSQKRGSRFGDIGGTLLFGFCRRIYGFRRRAWRPRFGRYRPASTAACLRWPEESRSLRKVIMLRRPSIVRTSAASLRRKSRLKMCGMLEVPGVVNERGVVVFSETPRRVLHAVCISGHSRARRVRADFAVKGFRRRSGVVHFFWEPVVPTHLKHLSSHALGSKTDCFDVSEKQPSLSCIKRIQQPGPGPTSKPYWVARSFPPPSNEKLGSRRPSRYRGRRSAVREIMTGSAEVCVRMKRSNRPRGR